VTRQGPWTVPDQDEARRIIWHLKHPDWRIIPDYYSQDGKWHARHAGKVDIEASTLGRLMDELDDYASTSIPELPRQCLLEPPTVLVSPTPIPRRIPSAQRP
jgi:hypothetical protein